MKYRAPTDFFKRLFSRRNLGALIIWASGTAALLTYSLIQAPIPAVNEPHYFGKARAFWDPSYAPGDLLYESSNPHWVFYVTFGSLTQVMSLPAAALVGRVLGLAALAAGWVALAGRVTRTHWFALPSIAFFLMLASLQNFSGEWLIGGCEAKVFSYAFLFGGLAAWLSGRTRWCAVLLGGAMSFHPVVGGWGVLGVVITEILFRLRGYPAAAGSSNELLKSLLILSVAAAPGVIPAVAVLGGGEAAEVAQANYIQVFLRLKHHLDPTTFPLLAYVLYAALIGAGAALVLASRLNASRLSYDRFVGFVGFTVALALAGVVVGWHFGNEWEMPLRNIRTVFLKFYPFRLADVFVPLAFSLWLPHWLTIRMAEAFNRRAMFPLTLLALLIALRIPSQDRSPTHFPPERLTAWKEACFWINRNTEPDAIVLAPNRHWGFKWYAHRAEFVNYKDAPQDTGGLLEWHRRFLFLDDWWKSVGTGQATNHQLCELQQATRAEFWLTQLSPLRFPMQPLFDNGWYRIYRLDCADKPVPIGD